MGSLIGNRWRLRPILQGLEAERDELGRKLVELAAKYPARQKSQALEQQIVDLKAELDEQRQVRQALAGGQVGITEGFGDYLEALARRHVQGTWIRSVSIDAGGSRVGITGSALEPELVTTYIQRLAGEAVFSGITFNVLDLEFVNLEFEDRVDFVLRTTNRLD